VVCRVDRLVLRVDGWSGSVCENWVIKAEMDLSVSACLRVSVSVCLCALCCVMR
jgi:hypothetical protein